MKLKMSFFSHLKMLTDLIVMSIVCFAIILCMPGNDFKLMFYFFVAYFIMFFLPTMVLHFNYLFVNYGVVFEISKDEIVKRTKDTVLKYTVFDIDEIIIYTGGTRGTVSVGLAHSNYYYAKIAFLDGSNFIITSLYSYKIDKILQENFGNVKISIEKVFYPMI
jgi:hypothetical protein